MQTEKYYVRPDVCCGGLCIRCYCCDKKHAKCCRVPFFLREPATRQKIDNGEAYISDLWAGWAHECCTKRDLYAIKFPQGADEATKITIVGAAHLLDIAFMEQDE